MFPNQTLSILKTYLHFHATHAVQLGSKSERIYLQQYFIFGQGVAGAPRTYSVRPVSVRCSVSVRSVKFYFLAPTPGGFLLFLN